MPPLGLLRRPFVFFVPAKTRLVLLLTGSDEEPIHPFVLRGGGGLAPLRPRRDDRAKWQIQADRKQPRKRGKKSRRRKGSGIGVDLNPSRGLHPGAKRKSTRHVDTKRCLRHRPFPHSTTLFLIPCSFLPASLPLSVASSLHAASRKIYVISSSHLLISLTMIFRLHIHVHKSNINLFATSPKRKTHTILFRRIS